VYCLSHKCFHHRSFQPADCNNVGRVQSTGRRHETCLLDTRLLCVTLSGPFHTHTCQRTPRPTCVDLRHRDLGQCGVSVLAIRRSSIVKQLLICTLSQATHLWDTRVWHVLTTNRTCHANICSQAEWTILRSHRASPHCDWYSFLVPLRAVGWVGLVDSIQRLWSYDLMALYKSVYYYYYYYYTYSGGLSPEVNCPSYY